MIIQRCVIFERKEIQKHHAQLTQICSQFPASKNAKYPRVHIVSSSLRHEETPPLQDTLHISSRQLRSISSCLHVAKVPYHQSTLCFSPFPRAYPISCRLILVKNRNPRIASAERDNSSCITRRQHFDVANTTKNASPSFTTPILAGNTSSGRYRHPAQAVGFPP